MVFFGKLPLFQSSVLFRPAVSGTTTGNRKNLGTIPWGRGGRSISSPLPNRRCRRAHPWWGMASSTQNVSATSIPANPARHNRECSSTGDGLPCANATSLSLALTIDSTVASPLPHSFAKRFTKDGRPGETFRRFSSLFGETFRRNVSACRNVSPNSE